MSDAPAVQFYPWDKPALEAGAYHLRISQHLENISDKPPADQAFCQKVGFERQVLVQGDRLILDPAHLGQVFPPAGGLGEYGDCLPHATLRRPTLPWERPLDAGTDRAPWMAVLLFDPDTYPAPLVQQLTMADLARVPPGALPATTACYGDGYGMMGRIFAPDWGEAWSDGCRVIDLDIAVFRKLAPTRAEIAWLTHSRHLIEGVAADPLDDPGHVALVVGNRLIRTDPTGQRRYTAHLVSLDCMGGFLLPDAVTSAPASDFTSIRLVSLSSWTFVSQDPRERFAEYFDNPGFSVGPMMFPLGAEAVAAAPMLAAAMAQGYVAVDHTTRLGEHTVSWYRGPLLPFAPAMDSRDSPEAAASADALLRYDDQSLAMFDTSYAAAWQLGRLLALRDVAYSQRLHQWKRQATDAARLTLLRGMLQDALGLEATAGEILETLIGTLYDPATLGAHRR